MKKLFGIGAILAAVIIIGNVNTPPQARIKGESVVSVQPIPTFASPLPTIIPTPSPRISPASPVLIPTPIVTTNSSSGLSNDDYYTNVDGNQAHAPAYSNSVPGGATAICGDGTYSFSQNRRGTCSHHGGVAQWL